MNTRRNNSVLQRGRRTAAFTLFESMLLVSMLGMSAAVVGESLSTMTGTAAKNDLSLQIDDQLVSQMEYLRSNYLTLGIGPTTASVTLDGVNYTVTRDIEKADPGMGSVQSTFLSLQVTLNGHQMTTYVSE